MCTHYPTPVYTVILIEKLYLGFYQKVWNVLKKTPAGIVVQGHMLAQQPTLSNMTRTELNFSLLVEDMLFKIHRPEYRQIIVELLCIVNTILLRNPELRFKEKLDLDDVITQALSMFMKVCFIFDMVPLFFFFDAEEHIYFLGSRSRRMVGGL